MTFLGLEKPVEYGRQLIFDPTMANMVLLAKSDYINAAREAYLLGTLELKDFLKTYGDFTSPIQKDMDWYNQNVTGKVRDAVNTLYANGIDPLRSAEGRAAVSLLIYSMPVGDIAKLRLSAETAKEYLKSFDDTTNPELEKFLGRDLSNWSTLRDGNNPANGVWAYNKASKYQTIDDLIEPIVKNVDYTYDEDMTKAHNDGNNYYSITKDRLMQAVNDNMSDILATPSGAFHWDLAKKAAAAQGGGEDLAKSIFKTMIGNRLSDHVRTKFEADPFKLDDHRKRNDISAYAAKARIDYDYKVKEASDPRLGGGNGNNYNKYNIFREAEALAPSQSSAAVNDFRWWGTHAGDHVGYIPSAQYSELIDPVMPASYVQAKDKDSGQVVEKWVFNRQSIRNNIYTIDDNNRINKAAFTNNNNSTSYEFIPDGQMKAARVGNNDYRYYISGKIRGNNGDFVHDENDGSTQVWVEVKERGHVYDGQLTKNSR